MYVPAAGQVQVFADRVAEEWQDKQFVEDKPLHVAHEG